MSLHPRAQPLSPSSGTTPGSAIKVGLLGYGFMAKAHTNAYRTIPYMFPANVGVPVLRAIAGRDPAALAEAAQRLGFEQSYTSWHDMLVDGSIDLFDNCASPNAHVEPTLAALAAGKHVFCEKPLSLEVSGALAVATAGMKANVKHMTGFNYRFVPAIQLARRLISEGALGDLYHVRIQYLQQSLRDPEQPMRKLPTAGTETAGAQAILGCHAVDLARFLVGEIATISALAPRFVAERIGPDSSRIQIQWDDATLALVEFGNGAVGSLEASRVCTGRRNSLRLEINGSQGSVGFDLERLNELQVSLPDLTTPDLIGTSNVMVTDPEHPYGNIWWPDGHVLGWEHAHINQLHHLLSAIATNGDVEPLGATLRDGYRAAAVADAASTAALTGARQTIEYAL